MADKTLKFLLLGEDRTASKALKGVGNEADKAGKKAEGAGKRMSKVDRAIDTVALAAAGTMILGFAGDAVSAASQTEQALGGTDAVFGKHAATIKTAASGAADSLGLSQNAYLELATTLGAGLKNKGIEDFAGQSQNLIGVGADLAAQFGGSTTDAVEALASAMRGESDPIEKYGVSLSESAVNAELAARGQDKLKGKALEQAKTQARLALITKQTADAHGAFGRESDTLAGKQARLDAKYKNMQSTIGAALMPAMSKLADIGMQVVAWATQNADVLGPLAVGLGVAAGAMVALNVAMAANPIGITVIAIAALVAGLVWAYNESEAFRNIVNGAFAAIGAVAKWLWNNALAPMIRGMITGFANVVDGIAWMLEALGNVPGFEWAKGAANNLRGLAKDARTLAGNIKDIPDADPQIKAKDEATAKIKAIDAKIKALKGKVVEAKAKGDDKEVKNLQKRINDLKSKKVNIQANVYKTGISTITARTTGSSTITVRAVARGGILGARRFANGGIEDHSPRIYGPGDGIRIFNEPETDGEAYIPLAADRRGRSVAIWRETGRRLGVYARGGITGGSGGDAPINAQFTIVDADPLAAARRIEAHLSKLWESKGRRPLAFQRG